MRRRKVEHFYFLVIAFTLSISIFYNDNVMHVGKASEQPLSAINDALIPPDIPPEHNSPITPDYYETSEYLIGSVAVGIIFLESNGTIDPSTENWTSAEESNVINKISDGLSWWANQNPTAFLSFKYAVNYSVPTSYEPINHPSSNESLWISEAIAYLGYPRTDYFTQVREYVNDLREKSNTNWAFAVFVVDSSNDADGKFANDYFAYAYLGGPFFVMTYDNNDWGIENMDFVAAHELGHIFYATDEYDGVAEYSGYLNVSDVDGSGGLMNSSAWFLSEGTKGQVGWRDSDSDDIPDIVDTLPDTRLVLYPSNLTNNSTLTYAGFVTEVPYSNNNPNGTGRDVTINTITKVEYTIDSTEWLEASPVDGAFDEAVENFTFTTQSLSSGTHIIEVRGVNSVGNIEFSHATHTVTVDITGPVTDIYPYPSYVTDTAIYLFKNTSFMLSASDVISDVATTYYKVDSESWTQYTDPFTLPNITDGIHTIYFYSVDNLGNEESTKSFTFIFDTAPPVVSIKFPKNGSEIKSSRVAVAWSGFDELSGVDHYEVRLDKGVWINVATNTTYTLSQLSDGTHISDVKVTDKAGNHKQDRIIFSVNTSLIGGPGWTDDMIVFSTTSIALAIILVFLLERQMKSAELPVR